MSQSNGNSNQTFDHRHILDGLASLFVMNTRVYGEMFWGFNSLRMIMVILILTLSLASGTDVPALIAVVIGYLMLLFSLFNLK